MSARLKANGPLKCPIKRHFMHILRIRAVASTLHSTTMLHDDDEDGVGDDAFDSDSRARNNSLLFINFMTEILP